MPARRLSAFFAGGLIVIALTGCAIVAPPPAPLPQQQATPHPAVVVTPAPVKPGNPYAARFGVATYYGRRFSGRRTASGQRLDPRKLTAASSTLPFGMQVRVTNVENGRSVVVVINDRGHLGPDCIDVTLTAARKLGISRSKGTAHVKIVPLDAKGDPFAP